MCDLMTRWQEVTLIFCRYYNFLYKIQRIKTHTKKITHKIDRKKIDFMQILYKLAIKYNMCFVLLVNV